MLRALFFPSVILLLLCGCSTTEYGRQALAVSADTSNVLELRIAASVDTGSSTDREAVACLRGFLQRKMDPEAVNDQWSAADTERFGALYPEVLYAEYDSVGDPRYTPTLLAILRPGPEDERILRVSWIDAHDGQGMHAPRCTFDFLAQRTDEGFRLSRPLASNTRTWERRQIGSVNYIISPRHRFDPEQAREQQAIIEGLSAFFDVDPFPITYYSFRDPADLFRTRGFVHHPLMWTIPSGGQVDERGNVFSGNNKDIYTHEVVHLFSHRRTKDWPR